MITGAHTLIYTTMPDELRIFFRDVLQLDSVDAGGGWLIFALPPAELALHPTEAGHEHHELGLMCDDVDATVAELRSRGAEFGGDVTDQRWGRSSSLRLPDGSELMLYEPRHSTAARRRTGIER